MIMAMSTRMKICLNQSTSNNKYIVEQTISNLFNESQLRW